MICHHENASSDGVFQYCEDCGATRARVPGKVNQYGEWHVCDLCRLPGPATLQRENAHD